MPDNRGDIVKVLPGTDPNKRRVAIVKRPDGYFAIRPEKWRVPDATFGIASSWVTINPRSGIFASVELAEKEAFAVYHWLKISN